MCNIKLIFCLDNYKMCASVTMYQPFQSQAVQQMVVEMEGLLMEVKRKDEEMCAREVELKQAITQGEMVHASLEKVMQDLHQKKSQCKSLQEKMGQVSPTTPNGFSDDDSPGREAELGGLKSQHREYMEAVQSLLKEREAKTTEYESHVARLEPQEQQMNQMREEFAQQRNWLVGRLEEMCDLFTGREKPVS